MSKSKDALHYSSDGEMGGRDVATAGRHRAVPASSASIHTTWSARVAGLTRDLVAAYHRMMWQGGCAP